MSPTLKKKTRTRPKFDAVVLWLLGIAAYYQMSPDSNFTFLPFPRRHDVYNLCLLDLRREEGDEEYSIDESHFMKTWREHRDTSNIKLRKHLRFAICDTCVKFRDLKDYSQDHQEKQQILAAEIKHHNFIKDERLTYYSRIQKGIKPFIDCVSIIADGADNGRYAVPYHHVRSHTSNGCARLPTHVMGVLMHGYRPHAYTYYENFKHGTNVTIEAIYRSLSYRLNLMGSLPALLYLQLDNTVKQCKSQFMMGFLAYLVLTGVFKHVVVSFLPVGHTHEDIDQLFSRIAIYLMCHDALSVEGLHECIRQSYQTKTGQRCHTSHWDRVTNFSDWIQEYLEEFTGITKWHQFRFYTHQTQGVVIQCREWTSLKEDWGGIHPNTPFTKAFKKTPPLSMVGVPDAQRRPLVTKEATKLQLKSIADCVQQTVYTCC
jgi:hypothetical protein